MILSTWNVNSIKVRLPQVLAWLRTHPVDVLCLQETKSIDANFPAAAFEEIGYQATFAGQKTYNGVAILSRTVPIEVTRNNPLFEDEQQRILAATIEGIRVICAYVPNGQSLDSEKYRYKLNWLTAFAKWIAEEQKHYPNIAILGDYNIAPEDRDVYDPLAWENQVLVSPPERAAFQQLLDQGFQDAFRLFDQQEKSYSWWDYRQMAFRRNLGMRIDHILLSEPLAKNCTACTIDRTPRGWEQPSDHTPVVAVLNTP